ncbi:hypothetical protein GQ53DRAFT_742844 [Thozetella sp. PMI_491]|nr:hypothetical protein GQ53DRAFT_742844 [Thozetella sp. PMI_491]
MDPVSAFGVGTGVISLAFDVFDNTIKLFKFLGALVDMPKDCQKYRLQLIMEYNRVLAWGKAAGLVDVPEGSDLGAALGTNATELVAIVARIQWLLAEFRELNSRHGNQLNPQPSEAEKDIAEAKATDVDVVRQVSSLAVSYEKKRKERRYLLGTNHIRDFLEKAAHSTKEVVMNPSRVRWVTVDEDTFKALLEDLHVLTERLHELMSDHQERKMDEITAKTYREMILVRNEVQDIREMIDAAAGLVFASSQARGSAVGARHNDLTLQDLVQLKRIGRTTEVILANVGSDGDFDLEKSLAELNITVPHFTKTRLDKDFGWNEDSTYPEELLRPKAVLTTPGGDIPVWVEWRTLEGIKPGSLRDKEARMRTVALAEMLHAQKPQSMCLPTCIGFYDDRDVSGADQYGWIFRMPEGSDYDTQVTSLFDLLGHRQHRPSLAERISLASKLASTLLHLHTINWLHKGILSENVVFYLNEDRFDHGSPVLSGFEYSRPEVDSRGAPVATTGRHLNPTWDVYRWPTVQRQPPRERNSRKTYDIYSLGLVLLEIAHWKPLHQLLRLEKWPEVPLTQSQKIRGWLLGEEAEPPFGDDNPVAELRHLVGDKYWQAVTRCLEAHGERGLGIEEGEDQSRDSAVGIQLQEAFSEQVVEQLMSVVI